MKNVSLKTDYSIIIPCYNAAGTIYETIDSVISQQYENFELIVVDDKSTDETIKIISEIKDKRLRIINNIQNLGRSFSRNQGIQKAVGARTIFLDADDLLVPSYLSLLNKKIRKTSFSTEKTVFYSRSKFFNSRLHITWTNHYEKGTISFTEVLKGNRFPICGLCFPTDFLKQHSLGFNTQLETYEDWLFIIQCFSKGAIFAFSGIPTPTSLIRVHGGNTMKKWALMAEGLDRMRSIAEKSLTEAQTKILFNSCLVNRGLLLGFNGIKPYLSFLSFFQIVKILLLHLKYRAKCMVLR